MSSVLKISEAASLAMHTMVFLAKNPGRQISVKEIAAAIHRSEFHLSKVLQRLARAGLLKSLRGPKGGFMLDGDMGDLSLYEVYEAIEGPVDSNPCIADERFCENKECIMGGLRQTVNHEFKEYMSQKRLRDFIETN